MGSVIAPTATQNMSMSVNLNSSTATNGTFSAPIQVYDSLGTAHTLTVNFTETAPGNWGYTVTIPAADLTSGGRPRPWPSGTLTFDSNGNLTIPGRLAGGSLPDHRAGGRRRGHEHRLEPVQQHGHAADHAVRADLRHVQPTQNGNAAGPGYQVSIQNSGLLVANYTNGQQVTVGQLAVASIANPTSLLQVGDNNLQASATTAQAASARQEPAAAGRSRRIPGILDDRHGGRVHQLLTYERSYQAARE